MEEMMNVETVCPSCGGKHFVRVNREHFKAWREDGVLIQQAMPELSADDRELLISGICADCWEKL